MIAEGELPALTFSYTAAEEAKAALRTDARLWGSMGGDEDDIEFPDNAVYIEVEWQNESIGFCIFHPTGAAGIWMGHAAFHSRCWGKPRYKVPMVAAGIACCEFVLYRKDVNMLVAEIPEDLPPVLSYAEDIGMQRFAVEDGNVRFVKWGSSGT